MKTLFEKADIEAGMFVISNRSPKNSLDYSFAESVTWKVCFFPVSTQSEYTLASVRDGMLLRLRTKTELCSLLNKKKGYRRLTKKEFLLQLEHAKGMRLD